MNKKSSRWSILVLLLLIGSAVHAEGECPPGMFPTNPAGTQGPVGCAPIPGYNEQEQAQPQQQAPPQKWSTEWGAIATDGPGGSFGAATNLPDKAAAETAAVEDCRSKKRSSSCKVELWYSNACASMVMGDRGHNAKAGGTVDIATQSAMNICKDADSNCHVYYSACSLPVRIQ